jgi:hypothetical protein
LEKGHPVNFVYACAGTWKPESPNEIYRGIDIKMQQVLSNNAKIGFLQLPSLGTAASLYPFGFAESKGRLPKVPLVRGVQKRINFQFRSFSLRTGTPLLLASQNRKVVCQRHLWCAEIHNTSALESQKPLALRDQKYSLGEQDDSSQFFMNIRFIGVGFRAYVVRREAPQVGAAKCVPTSNFTEEGSIRFLMLKVGQSALTAYPIPAGINIYCPKDQQADKEALLLIGNNLQTLKQVGSEIKSYKKPDPYKGSGIYECERIETESGEILLNEKILRKIMKKK